MAHVIEHAALKPLKEKFPATKFMVGEFRQMVTVVVPREDLRPSPPTFAMIGHCATKCSPR